MEADVEQRSRGLETRPPNDGSVLVTYGVTHVEHSNPAAVRVRSADRWALDVHQGTPTTP